MSSLVATFVRLWQKSQEDVAKLPPMWCGFRQLLHCPQGFSGVKVMLKDEWNRCRPRKLTARMSSSGSHRILLFGLHGAARRMLRPLALAHERLSEVGKKGCVATACGSSKLTRVSMHCRQVTARDFAKLAGTGEAVPLWHTVSLQLSIKLYSLVLRARFPACHSPASPSVPRVWPIATATCSGPHMQMHATLHAPSLARYAYYDVRSNVQTCINACPPKPKKNNRTRLSAALHGCAYVFLLKLLRASAFLLSFFLVIVPCCL